MKNRIFILFFLFISFSGYSQINISVQLPASGFVPKSQLWNVVLINNNGEDLQIMVRFTLSDANTGQPLLSAASGSFLMNKGVKLLKEGDVQPIQYNNYSIDFSKDFLPIGSYIICYQIISEPKQQIVGEECVRINIDPLSPPLLNTPFNGEELNTHYPQFSWMPPTALEMFNRLNYDLIVSEILPGQTATDAIMQNSPIYSRNNITQTYDQYPSSYLKLDTGKIYAWQIIAKNGESFAAKTEVWKFKIKPVNLTTSLIDDYPFIQLKQESPEHGIAPNGILKISYRNETADTTVIVHLLETGNASKADNHFELRVISGENLLQKDIRNIIHPKVNKVYEAYIINSRKEKWYTLFEIANIKKTQ